LIEVRGAYDSQFEVVSQHTVTEKDIKLQAFDRPANLLRMVPGLITTNPGGGPGKPETIYSAASTPITGLILPGFWTGCRSISEAMPTVRATST
jgi:hypothetical protein